MKEQINNKFEFMILEIGTILFYCDTRLNCTENNFFTIPNTVHMLKIIGLGFGNLDSNNDCRQFASIRS